MPTPPSIELVHDQPGGVTEQRSPASSAFVSVIVPMLNEVDNVDELLGAILSETGNDLSFEILIADGGSTDGTIERVKAWEDVSDVRLVAGDGKRGLAGDVLHAASVARSHIVVVMDGDLSHPADRIRALVQPLLDGTSDMVVGSRFVASGRIEGWPLRRLALSRLGALLAWPLTEIKDPMSGFFAVGRDRILAVDPNAAGFKIGLEIIARGGGALRVDEVPITFGDRVRGQSKIGWAQMTAYIQRLFVLAGGSMSTGGAARFAMVGLSGMVVDLLVFQTLHALNVAAATAQAISFCVATLSNYYFNSRWTFAGRSELDRAQAGTPYLRFVTVCLLALAIRGGMLASATDTFHIAPQIAIFFAIGGSAAVNYLGSAFFVFPPTTPRTPFDIRWRVAAIGVVGYCVALRLIFIGLADLLPQEAYYWNYSQHLDIGYLDHPPLVAWLIRAGTNLFGNTEFGVRIAAWIAWFITAYFSFRLTKRMFGKSAAFVSLLLVAALPYYFGAGLFMTPDAPLAAAWAGTLYFLERALIGEQRRSWWGVGICFGLGLLSKYTIILLAPPILIFMLMDTRARVLMARREPYVAAALALLIFSPVIYWNLENDFASFAFQSTQRLQSSFEFSLPDLIFNSALLISPTGLLAAAAALWSLRTSLKPSARPSEAERISRFMLVFTVAPLAVFFLVSLSREVKLNWTGPVWLAVLPAISIAILSLADRSALPALAARKVWAATVAISLLTYGAALNYVGVGVPGLGYPLGLPNVPVAWEEFGREASDLKLELKKATGEEPLMIALDAYNIASELAFYASDGNGAAASVGRGVLGRSSLMYEFWFHPATLRGRPAVMFAFKPDQIKDASLEAHFSSLSEPMEREVVKGEKSAGRFYYRVGRDLR